MAIIPLALCTIPLMRKRVHNQARFSGRQIFRRRVAGARLGEQRVKRIAPHRRFFLRGLFDRRLGGIRRGRFRRALVSCRRLGFGRSFGRRVFGGSLRRSLGGRGAGRLCRRRRRGLRSAGRLGSCSKLDSSVDRAPHWAGRSDVLAPKHTSQEPPRGPAATGFAMILRVA